MKSSAIRVEGKLKLSGVDASAIGAARDKENAVRELERLRAAVAVQQEKLFAEGRQSLLLVFEAMDTGGKAGAIRN